MILSPEAEKLFQAFSKRYVTHGFMYAGSMRTDVIKRTVLGNDDKALVDRTIDELIAAGKIRQRDCSALSYELMPVERAKLIKAHQLTTVWLKGGGKVFYPLSQYGEITRVRKELTGGFSKGRPIQPFFSTQNSPLIQIGRTAANSIHLTL
jgi:hypothetical protein